MPERLGTRPDCPTMRKRAAPAMTVLALARTR